MPTLSNPLIGFEHNLRSLPDLVASLKTGLIGGGTEILTPEGPKPLIYADYVASGRALRQVEEFMLTEVLPYYANSHTEASFTGARTTALREAARATIAEKCAANEADHAVIFAGSGATTGLNRLVHLFGIREALSQGEKAFVLVGPYEHHSNLLPWRESGAEVLEVAEAPEGGIDLSDLIEKLAYATTKGMTVAAFSAASNVTGICTDIATITRAVKTAGARMVWDYAGGGPYLPINMAPAPGAEIDAIALSPHKFIGGPGASGVLIVRRDAVSATTPSQPGGGTVRFVNAHQHDYLPRLEDREEGGTPNILGDIRAALTLIVKDVIGQDRMTTRNADLAARAFSALDGVPGLRILGADHQNRLPIISFVIDTPDFNHNDFTTRLSDQFGIQARGGCSCAGPYVHRLMHIDDQTSNRLRSEILSGDESHKPGFVRFNLSVLMPEDEVDYILSSVAELAGDSAGRKAA
jgi:selenocysteine lyase/cysteine desulfurase